MGVREWLDDRTGYRAALRHVLDEPLPNGTGWLFTTGSVVLFLLAVQLLSGVVLAMYYVPTPSLAYDSVRYITDDLAYGAVVRGLHFWGASFIVVFALIHLLRVFLHGSFKAPREVTWMTGVFLLFVILAFALSGYLLPWDQKAYWATTVTLNIARTAPLVGAPMASMLGGGPVVGALTLGRWYVAHILLLPAVLILFVVAHVVLMRRHGISGPLRKRQGVTRPFYPWHAMKDTLVIVVVFAGLLGMAVTLPAALDDIANPADEKYVPRPEWYFLSLFQLLKYFPGPLEPLAAIVIPGLVVAFVLFLPFLDRSADRHPLHRSRVPFTLSLCFTGVVTAYLTALGWRDSPPRADINDWGPRSLAGYALVTGVNSTCAACHAEGGVAAELTATPITRDDEWLLAHVADPVAIAPGVRTGGAAAPPAMTRVQAQGVVAYLRRVRAGASPPQVAESDRTAATIFSGTCAGCHKIAGEGGETGPDLSRVGSRRDVESIRRLIQDPRAEFPDAIMPTFGSRLSADQIEALARYLSTRR